MDPPDILILVHNHDTVEEGIHLRTYAFHEREHRAVGVGHEDACLVPHFGDAFADRLA